VTKAIFLRRGRLLVFLVVAMVALTPADGARAAQDPCDALAGGTIRWIVPFGPGGYDAYSRILAPFLATRLDAEVVVVNMPGAGGLVGAKHLRKAKPDGRTLGLLHGSSLLVAELFGNPDSPRLRADFTLLGRLTRDSDVWVVADASRFRTVDDLYAKGGDGPVVGVTSTASKHWLSAIIIGNLLGFEADIVSGYKGSKSRLLGLLRGDFEMMGTVASTAVPRIEAGEVRALLKIGESIAGRHPVFRDVPRLEGPDGLAVRRARTLGRDIEAARARASALAGTIGAGRIIAAPPGMDPGLTSCLEDRLFEAMEDPALGAAMTEAGRPLDIARGTTTAALIRQAKDDARPKTTPRPSSR
jgi:tripartite-type tricarboxylate transporter receptor subunit TctC